MEGKQKGKAKSAQLRDCLVSMFYVISLSFIGLCIKQGVKMPSSPKQQSKSRFFVNVVTLKSGKNKKQIWWVIPSPLFNSTVWIKFTLAFTSHTNLKEKQRSVPLKKPSQKDGRCQAVKSKSFEVVFSPYCDLLLDIKWGRGGDQDPKVLRFFLLIIDYIFEFWAYTKVTWQLSKMRQYKSYLTDVQKGGGSRPLLDNVKKKDTFLLDGCPKKDVKKAKQMAHMLGQFEQMAHMLGRFENSRNLQDIKNDKFCNLQDYFNEKNLEHSRMKFKIRTKMLEKIPGNLKKKYNHKKTRKWPEVQSVSRRKYPKSLPHLSWTLWHEKGPSNVTSWQFSDIFWRIVKWHVIEITVLYCMHYLITRTVQGLVPGWSAGVLQSFAT